MDEYVGIEEFAAIYGCTVRHAQRLCREGKAPRHIRIGRTVRFKRVDLDEWIKARTVNPENK